MSTPTKLFNKNFILLWLGQSVSQVGNGAGFIATMWWVQQTTGSALALGTLAMIKALISVLLSPFAGVLVDRFDRKKIIVITDIIRGLVYVYFSVALSAGTLTLFKLYIGTAAISASSQFFGPAIASSVPHLVPKEKLEKANSLQQLVAQAGNIMSYALGGVLVAVLGVPLLLLVDAISYIISAGSEMFISIPTQLRQKTQFSAKGFVHDLKEGFSYIRSDNVLRNILPVMAGVNFFFVPFFILLPKLVSDHLGAGSVVYGYIESAQVAGMLMGSILMTITSYTKRHVWPVKWGIAIQALGFLVLPLMPKSVWLCHVLVYGIYGVFNVIVNVSFFSILQRRVEDKYMGKVFAFVTAATSGLMPIASGICGVIGDLVPIGMIFTGSAVLGVLCNIKLALVPELGDILEDRYQTHDDLISQKLA